MLKTTRSAVNQIQKLYYSVQTLPTPQQSPNVLYSGVSLLSEISVEKLLVLPPYR